MPDKLIIDEEIRKLIPPLTDEERQQLEANLKSYGCRDPLTVWDGPNILLDGHNRKEICDANGIGYRVSKINLPDRSTALTWVIFNQLGRRNLNSFQRAELALAHQKIIADDGKRRQLAGKTPEDDLSQNLAREERRTDSIIGTAADVSRGTVNSVRKIKENAAPEVVEMARKGDVSVDAARKVSTLPKDKQKAVAAAGPKAVKEKAKQIRQGEPSEAEPEVRDGRGEVVTDPKLIPIFRDAAERFDAALGLLRQISTIVNPLLTDDQEKGLPAGRFLKANEWRTAHKTLRNFLNGTRPHAPCPYPTCGPKCEACKGLGFVIESTWDVAPSGFKAQMKKGKK